MRSSWGPSRRGIPSRLGSQWKLISRMRDGASSRERLRTNEGAQLAPDRQERPECARVAPWNHGKDQGIDRPQEDPRDLEELPLVRRAGPARLRPPVAHAADGLRA